jgi:hypothetical protein
VTDRAELPAPALVLCFLLGQLPPPWYVPVEAPACGAVLDVAAEATTDGVARRFVCDLPSDHDDDKHRQVTDNTEGEALTWPRSSTTWPTT